MVVVVVVVVVNKTASVLFLTRALHALPSLAHCAHTHMHTHTRTHTGTLSPSPSGGTSGSVSSGKPVMASHSPSVSAAARADRTPATHMELGRVASRTEAGMLLPGAGLLLLLLLPLALALALLLPAPGGRPASRTSSNWRGTPAREAKGPGRRKAGR